MLNIPNIYNSKRVKYFPLVPLVLFFVALFFWSRLTLDSSLSGGVSIILQTNSTLPSAQIASYIAQELHSPQPTIQRSSGEIQITISENASLADAEAKSLEFYSYQQNYTASLLNVTTISAALKTNSTNVTLQRDLSSQEKILNTSLVKMNSTLAGELADLRPFIGAVAMPSTQSAMLSAAQNSYTNASNIYTDQVISTMHSILPFTSYSYQDLGPTLGRYFLSQLFWVIVTAFVLISIAVLIIFRSIVPAFTVVFGAANDIVIAIGAMAILGIPLGTASIGGLLMIIGYAIDTDVLAAYRVLKTHGGTPEERAFSSMKTGLTMTMTALVSFSVLFIVALFTYVPTYYEVAGVALLGLAGDIATAWLGNAPLILMWKKRKERV